MKKLFYLLAAAILVSSCMKSYHQPKVDLLVAYPFPSHNNNVEAYFNADKFPDPRSYVKIGVIQQTFNTPDINKQMSNLKRIAQQYGADGLLILGINDPGIKVATQKKLGNDVIDILNQKEETDYYTNIDNNEISVLAIKSKRNLDAISQTIKNMLMYKYDTKNQNFKLVDIYKFSLDNQLTSGDKKNPDFQNIKSYSSFFLTYDKSPNWKENTRNRNLIVREYNDLVSPRMISSTSLNNDGNIEQIIKLYPRTQKRETITYTYYENKPVGRTIITKDKFILEEQYRLNKQNNIEEVTIYNHNGKTKAPVYKLTFSYYNIKDVDSILVKKRIN
jgi:hypothetical protein